VALQGCAEGFMFLSYEFPKGAHEALCKDIQLWEGNQELNEEMCLKLARLPVDSFERNVGILVVQE
jgi:hypothetical protein